MSRIRYLKSVFERVAGHKPRMGYFTSLEEADSHRRTHPDVRQLIWLRDRIVKRQSPGLARFEFEKTRRAIRVGEDTGLFHVPAILDYDERTGTISFARLNGYRPLNRVLRELPVPEALMEKVAHSLAAVHTQMHLPEEMVVPPPRPLCRPGTDVFLHGDFSTLNLALSGDDTMLGIFDWAASDLYGGRATAGPYMLELAWFIMGLLRRRALGWGRLQVYGFGELANADQLGMKFINHYLHASGRSADLVLLNEYFRAVYEYVLSRHGLLRRGINAASEKRRFHQRLLRFVDGHLNPS